MVAFRVLTQEIIAQQLSGTIKAHEMVCWEMLVSLGHDPMEYGLRFAVSDSDNAAEVSMADYQGRLINAYAMAGVSSPTFAADLTDEQKIASTEKGLARIEEKIAERCGEHGVDPADLVEGWTGTEGQQELEDLLALALKAHAVLAALGA